MFEMAGMSATLNIEHPDGETHSYEIRRVNGKPETDSLEMITFTHGGNESKIVWPKGVK